VPAISVIVPTRNEARNIPRFLASTPPDVELIVCDASTDETPELVYKLRPGKTLVIDAPGTIADARQLGAEASSGDFLVFTDADVAFDRRYFAPRVGWTRRRQTIERRIRRVLRRRCAVPIRRLPLVGNRRRFGLQHGHASPLLLCAGRFSSRAPL
jgi:glycosyltransferase involved in cell wall biosynthesis